MTWDVEYTNEFGDWWAGLAEGEQEDVTVVVELLAEYGSRLPFPYSSGVSGSRHGHMRELRVQTGARPARTRILRLRPETVGDSADRRRQNRDDRFYERFRSTRRQGCLWPTGSMTNI